MYALEDLREGLALLEIQVRIVGGLRQTVAPVVRPDQVFVSASDRPTGPHGQRRVKLAFDLADIEVDRQCRCGEGGCEADGQRQFRQAPGLLCFCHRRYSMYFFVMDGADYSQRV
ncbi:hypothetical protein D3C84_891670 [compost metagenome]